MSPLRATAIDAIRNDPTELRGLRRGIEKESLRVNLQGELSAASHPRALGSTLTHPHITTDFSEAQLELITGVHPSATDCLNELRDIHRFIYQNLDGEMLWPSSMPCLMGNDEDVPIGQYGSSNIGRAKTVYRRGLGLRYGRLMQTISGIHYNFSVPETLWQTIGCNSQAEITTAYFGLIRNFRRWSWLLIYLFGASPAVCKSFTRNLDHNLQAHDEGSQYLPFATSLRMGPLGYQSNAQSALHISYNSLEDYAASMIEALTTPYPEYAKQGVRLNSEYQQLNTSIIQIENEFYGTIRPKRTIQRGERPVTALRQRGVEYVEVRCLDLNPFLDVGIDAAQARFIDVFLLVCLLSESPPDSTAESQRMLNNQVLVVEEGRRSDLRLQSDDDQSVSLQSWAKQLLEHCRTIAAMLDNAHDTDAFTDVVAQEQMKIDNAALTPSARVLAVMRDQQIPFFRFTLERARSLRDGFLADPLSAERNQFFVDMAKTSLERQQQLEAQETQSFDDFLVDYLALPQ